MLKTTLALIILTIAFVVVFMSLGGEIVNRTNPTTGQSKVSESILNIPPKHVKPVNTLPTIYEEIPKVSTHQPAGDDYTCPAGQEPIGDGNCRITPTGCPYGDSVPMEECYQ